ncbi:acyl-CoA dehydrogenase [Pseudonocardia sp. TMWB2A]|uniref:acyl-CoA dehydrogenase family protein n=1 Tax=Pseudonocardia sp. TMWB2A TaxID=687430 RepID=UPI00307F3484
MAVSFVLSPEQEKLKVTMSEFAHVHLAPLAERVRATPDPREASALMREVHEKDVEAGVLRTMIPAELGGTAAGGIEAAIMWEELCTVMPDIMDTFGGAMLALGPVMTAGTPEQIERLIEPFLADSGAPTAALAFSEPGGSANYDAPPPAPGLQTRAELDGDEWVITGEKEWAAHLGGWDGIGPDLMVVVCRTPGGISMIAVERAHFEAGGLTVLEYDDTIGFRGTPTCRVRLDGVRVPRANLIGHEGGGVELTTQAFTVSAGAVAVLATSSMRAAFDDAFDFATREHRGGPVPVIEHRVVADVLSDAKGRIEATRLLAWRALDAAMGGSPSALEWCLHAKVLGSETAVDVINQLVRVVGIQAYNRSNPIMHRLFDALAYPIFEGGNISMRRRQLQGVMTAEGWDPLQASGMA